MAVRQVTTAPILSDFGGSNGTPLVIDVVGQVPYYLAPGNIIIDMRTGAQVGYGVEDDLRIPASQFRLGATVKPDYDFTNLGLLFPQNDATEVANFITQLPHEYALNPNVYLGGTDIIPHIHFRQTGATLPTFNLDYKWFNDGEIEPANFTTITTISTGYYTWVSGNLAQKLRFPAISGTGKNASSTFLGKLYRTDNAVTGDVLVREFDIHYLKFCRGTVRS